MPFTTLLAGVTPGGFTWMPIADAVFKASLLLGAAGIACFTLRRASASVRHLIWTLALAGSIAIPVLSGALPRWQVNVMTMPATFDAAPQDPLGADRTASPPASPRRAAALSLTTPASASAQAPQTLGSAAGDTIARWASGVRWETLAIALWLGGFLIVGARLVVGLIAVQWISRRMAVVDDASWLPLARRLASDLGIATPVRFLRSARATMPMAWGLLRPTVLMPADADNWPADRLRIVLLHELAHVRRRDCLTHLLAQAACAVYWFHPLAWIAARRARSERERACDDLVLAAGTRGSDYAEELLQIARVTRPGRFPAVTAGATLAMAHRSQLEGRLLAILDPAVPRGGLTRGRALATSIACSVAIMPLAALQPGVQKIGVAQLSAAAVPAPSALQQPNVPAPAPRPDAPATAPIAQAGPTDPLPSQPADEQILRDDLRSGVRGALQGISEGLAESVQEAVLGAVDGDVAHALGALQAFSGQNPNPNPNPKPDPNPATGQSRRGDPRTVAALTAALKDTDAEVRETAMQALVQMRDPSIFDPLVAGLRDASADVREQAAHGLGQLRDRRAVDPLVGAMKDSNASVREQAVFALGQLRDPSALEALGAALKDAAADVREQAAFALGQIKDKRATTALAAALADASDDVREQVVFALGQLRDPAAIDGLTTALRDAKPNVREQAAFSLGQIRDRRATDPLVAALKDASPDVRQQAAFALGQIRDQGSVAALVMALKDADAEVREQVAFALGQLRDPRAIDALTTALKDASAGVRQQAAFALGQLAR